MPVPPAIVMLIESVENVGGMEYQAIRLSRRLEALGHSVTFVEACPLRGYLREPKRLRGEIAGIPLIRLPALKRWRPLFLASYGMATALTLVCLRNRFDVLHVHQLSESALPATLTAKRLGKRVVVKLTSAGAVGDLARLRQRAHPAMTRALLRSVDRFAALTTEIQQELIDAGVDPGRITVIPNGVDTEVFRPVASTEEREALRAALGLPGGPLFVFVGRLAAKKRVDLLLDGWALVRRQVPAASLAIVGSGPLDEPLRRQADRAHLGESVRFVGESDRVADYLRAADVFVLPSVSEGLSNALLEAMSSGLAAVVTDSSGVRDVVRDGHNGRLFGDETAAGLARLLVALATEPERREALGFAARRTVEASFSLDSVARRYHELYEALLDRPEAALLRTPEASKQG